MRADVGRLVAQVCLKCPFEEYCARRPQQCKAWIVLEGLFVRLKTMLEEIEGTKELEELMSKERGERR